MDLHGWPTLYLLFVWWFSTLAIIYLDGLPRRTFRWSFLGATLLFGLALAGLAALRDDTSVRGAYLALTCGVLAWGWQEVSFYMGYVTGPRREPCPEGCGGLRHFGHAIGTSLYHELAIIASAGVVAWVTWGGANQVGWWTFVVMWWMHQSAKLNVFLGVRNLNEEFLPEHLQFLRSFLTRKPMNLLFPVSVTVSTVIAAMLLGRAFEAGATPFEAVAFTFLGGLMVLAILEHWFLVVPLPAAALWSWGLRSRSEIRPVAVEVAAGFLGAGKTTFLRRRLADADPAGRTLVLVNDFAQVGVDGTLLSGRGADVIELANGCFCCTLRDDLTRQMRDVIHRLQPDRILIEPSGVAEIGALLAALRRPELTGLVREVHVVALLDASAFLADYARMPSHFEAQLRAAPLVLVNKADLVSPGELSTIEDTVRSLNPDARIVPARYGRPLAGEVRMAAPLALRSEDHQAQRHAPAPEFESWNIALDGCYDEGSLRAHLATMATGVYGAVLRAKGIARVGRGWVHFDLAGGQVTVAGLARRDEAGRAVAIGTRLHQADLADGFRRCRTDLPDLVPLPALAG